MIPELDRLSADAAPAPGEPECFPGLDVELGLSLVFDKVALYRKLLCCYHENAMATSQMFDDALAARDRGLISRLVHTLKGTSGTLGMHKVYAAAVRVEEAGSEVSLEQLTVLLNALKAEQEDALASIERYLAKSG